MADMLGLVNGTDRELLFIRSLHQEKDDAGEKKQLQMPEHWCCAVLCSLFTFQAPEFLNPIFLQIYTSAQSNCRK
jgi:hypothetical protein